MGFSVATTVLSKAVTYDLVTLAAAKISLSIAPTVTTNDAWLGQGITGLSGQIANHLERVFAPEVVQDVFDIQQDAYPSQTPGGFPEVQLSRWPVIAIASVVQTISPGSTQTLVEGQDFRTIAATGQLLRLSPFTGAGTLWEARPLTVQYVAGYGEAVTEVDAVPAAAPYQVTVSEAAAFSCDQGVSYANGAALTAVRGVPAAGQYALNPATPGIYTFAPADAGAALTFNYAVADIPPDLQDVMFQLIGGRFSSKGRDPALIQRETPGVGVERFWLGGAPGQSGPFPPDVEAILAAYDMPVVA